MNLSPRQTAALDHALHTFFALLVLFVVGTIYQVLQGPNASSLIKDPAILGFALLVVGAAFKFATAQTADVPANPTPVIARDVVDFLSADLTPLPPNPTPVLQYPTPVVTASPIITDPVSDPVQPPKPPPAPS